MKHYEEKLTYLLRKQKGLCYIAKAKGKIYPATELHHMLIHNTKTNKKKYPLLINSVWNLVAVSNKYHLMYPSFGRCSYLNANKIESFLQRHPMIAAAVNMT